MTCASSNSFFASSPTVASLKILGYPRLGYRPRNCQTWKKGFQSTYASTSSSGKERNDLVPTRFGFVGMFPGSDQSTLNFSFRASLMLKYLGKQIDMSENEFLPQIKREAQNLLPVLEPRIKFLTDVSVLFLDEFSKFISLDSINQSLGNRNTPTGI